ncbi:MAG: hypothetical protein JO112_24085, partial [Planctomycetes bacterium]|nr:hypothetical protein [Planctomycetota bacterium]
LWETNPANPDQRQARWVAWHEQEAADAERLTLWFTMDFHLGRVIEARPNDPALYRRRADPRAEMGRWAEAGADLARAIELDAGDPRPWFKDAQVRLKLGDLPGYRKDCAAMVERFGRETNPVPGLLTAWTCVLAPEAVADPGQAVRLAEQAVQAFPGDVKSLQTLGAALYRAGRWADAVQRLTEAAAGPDEAGNAWDWLFLAMAHQQLGHREEARKWLNQAEHWLNQTALEEAQGRRQRMPWYQRLELEVLRQEGERGVSSP